MIVKPPTAPPEPVVGVPSRTFVACDGLVWRRSMQGWDTIDAPIAPKLLDGFRRDALNTDDWWHRRAAELADELEAAITEAAAQRIAA